MRGPAGVGRALGACTWFAAVLPLVLGGCSDGTPEKDRRVLVLAASSLQYALPEIVEEFERRTGTGVDVVLGSSGNLAVQIEHGAPADLFLSADRRSVDRLLHGGFTVPGSVRNYATGRITVVGPPGRPVPASLAALAAPGFTVIALANPETAPYGLAALQALDAVGLRESLEPRLVYAENVAQAAQFVRTGNADAGILALSVVLEVEGWEHRMIDPAFHAPIVQAASLIVSGPNTLAASDLLDLIVSTDGVEILARYGFGPVGG